MICEKCLTKTELKVCITCEVSRNKLRKIHLLSDNINKLLEGMEAIKLKLSPNERVLMGVSGGVDSSFLACAAGIVGLPVQLIHFDNGWNTQLAVENINKLIDRFDFDLETFVQDWPTFRSLQRSFLFSGVPDIEVVSDHAIFSILLNFLSKRDDIRYVISGGNFSTEHGLNEEYVWNKWDVKNIKDINRRYENIDLGLYPSASIFSWLFFRKFSSKKSILFPLNNYYYKRTKAVEFLKDEIDFVDYEFKHEESLITKVFQRTILPKKYNYFKVEDHLSALIRNKEINKSEALRTLKRFKNSKLDQFEFEYFCEKLSITDDEWIEIINGPKRGHGEFLTNRKLFATLSYIGGKLGLRSMT